MRTNLVIRFLVTLALSIVAVIGGGFMRASRMLFLMFIISCAALHSGASVAASSIVSGWGTPNVNGIFVPNEWSSAGTASFNANTPGGATTPATLYVMNDATNIYLAVRYARSSASTTSLSFYFDKDNNNTLSVGDDTILLNNPSEFYDEVVAPCCGGGISNGQFDTDFGGTFEGGGAFANDGMFSVHELWHPLRSSDAAHDIQLFAGQTVGVRLDLRIIGTGNIIADTAFGFVPVVTAAGPAFAVQTYTAIPLGTLGGGTAGFGINDNGQVTGLSYPTSGPFHAFIYYGGTMRDLGTLSGTSSSGSGINVSSQVVGSSGIAGNTFITRAFLYSGGVMRDLGTLGGTNSGATAINASGHIVGSADTAGNAARRAFLYSGGVMRDLGTLGGTNSGAAAINASGQIVGSADTMGNAARHAFLYSDSIMFEIGTLGGTNSDAAAVNASGQIVGSGDIAGNAARHAFLYSGGTMQDLGTRGGTASGGSGINANGEVIGSYGTPADTRAFLYSGGTMYDLQSLVVSGLGGATLRQATAINDRGQIVANTCTIVPSCTVFRLDPIPGSATGSAFARNYVHKAYVAYYGRPADPDGLGYWATRMDAEGGSLNAIIGQFGYSDEFNRRYGGLGYAAMVTKVYQQALGRNPDPSGLSWYVNELLAGRRTLQTITLDVLNGATSAPDSTVVANKLTVAAYYTAKVAAGCPYGTEQDGVDVVTIVTALPASVAAAEAAIDAGCGP